MNYIIYTVRLILEAIFFIWLINGAIELFFDVNLIDIIKKYVKRLMR